MIAAHLSAHQRFRLDGTAARLVRRNAQGDWQVEDEVTGNLRQISELELLQHWDSGRLEFMSIADPDDGPEPRSLPIESLKPSEQERVRWKARFLKEMELRQFRGWHAKISGQPESAFERSLREVADQLRIPPLCAATYYNWRRELDEAEGDVCGLAGRYRHGRSQVDPRAKVIIRDVMREAIERAMKTTCSPRRPPQIFGDAKAAIDHENMLIARQNADAKRDGRPLQEPISKPLSATTFHRYWKAFPAFERKVTTHGWAVANREFRGGRGHARPEVCLDRVEYDETQLPVFAYHEPSGIALGRPWFGWYICCAAQLPLGFYMGFERTSDLSITSALKSACLPKAFLSQAFPGTQEYPVFGIPRFIVFDNAMAQLANTIEAITANLHNSHQFAPSYTPWFKARVESSFNVMNQALLAQLPGVVLKGVAARDYNPARDGCLGLTALYQLIWKWITTIYAREPHTQLRKARIDVWMESAAQHPPSLISSKRCLDELFGVVRQASHERIGNHDGVSFEGLSYYSPEFHALRRRHGESLKLIVKVNPADLEHILVRVTVDLPWVRVQAIDSGYARGMSLHLHKLCREYARANYGSKQRDALERAKADLAHLISDLFEDSRSIQATSIAAKAMGFGSQLITDLLDHQGRICPKQSPAMAQLPGNSAFPLLAQPSELAKTSESEQETEDLPRFSADLSLGPSGR